jgi:CDP-diacylglycerol--glycerol-3-phosphate 3-phosphatidyltransferase
MSGFNIHFNLATCLTWLRIALIPAVVGVHYLPDTYLSASAKNTVSMLLFVLAALTDWFDGYIARKYNQSSAFGAFLDPVADKLMVVAALCVLMEMERVNAALAFLIIGRELTISALREWMASAGKRASVAVNSLGKLKTIAQMLAIPLLLFDATINTVPVMGSMTGLQHIHTRPIGTALLLIAALLTILSMVYYFRLAAKALRIS